MSIYTCGTEARREAVLTRRLSNGQPIVNGIDYLEVEADASELTLFFLHPLPGQPNGTPAAPVLDTRYFRITGGERIMGVQVMQILSTTDNRLVLETNSIGDFSTYTLRLINPANPDRAPDDFDPQLSEVDFSFKIDCPSPFDCKDEEECTPELETTPPLDYLARDYASFRRLLLDRIAVTIPDWTERNPADPALAVMEALAYVGDQLSYYQDAVATESYLGTARRRTSVRRHARLLDYPMHEGANARTWVQLQVDGGADGVTIPGPQLQNDPAISRPGTLLVTRTRFGPANLTPANLREIGPDNPVYFETLHDLTPRVAHNELRFYSWADRDCCLPAGSTRATLERINVGGAAQVQVGDFLLFEEVRSAVTGATADANPATRHIVRVTTIEVTEDPLFPADESDPDGPRLSLLEIEWDAADALPFSLCISVPEFADPISVARGNIVLADHGRTLAASTAELTAGGRNRYRLTLTEGEIIQQAQVQTRNGAIAPFDAAAPATEATRPLLEMVRPALYLREASNPNALWLPRRDLLNSSRFSREFALEPESKGWVYLRFGDGLHGQQPPSDLIPTVRVGSGAAGNVGAGAIAHIVGVTGVVAVRNPIAAGGGVAPERLERVKQNAPAAFKRQERAVTAADWVAAAQRHPAVARAVATRRWTGSWITWYLTIDRVGGLPVDADFETDLRRFLERFRLAGYDLEIDGPRDVPLELKLHVCVKVGYFRADVLRALLTRFNRFARANGRRGFFHPDNFTFGQPLYLSAVLAAAMEVPGVQWVHPVLFTRRGQLPHSEIEDGLIAMGRLEILRTDNDPNRPERGQIEFEMEGGS